MSDNFDDENNPFGSRFSDEGLSQGEISDSLFLKYIVTIVITLIIAAIIFVVSIYDDFENLNLKDAVSAASTALFIAGIASGGIGAKYAMRSVRPVPRLNIYDSAYNSPGGYCDKSRKERTPFAKSNWIVVGFVEIILGIGISYGYEFLAKILG